MERFYRIRISKKKVGASEHLLYPQSLGKDFVSIACSPDFSEAVVKVDGTREQHGAIEASEHVRRLTKKEREGVVEQFHALPTTPEAVASLESSPAPTGLIDATSLGDVAAPLEDWQPGSLLNGWENFGKGYTPAGFLRDRLGFVHLRGVVKGGEAGDHNIIFELTPECWPPFREIRIVAADKGGNLVHGFVEIEPEGAVVARSGGMGWLSLDGIVFKAP